MPLSLIQLYTIKALPPMCSHAGHEDGTDVITNIRKINQFSENGKTGGIGVKHFGGF